MALGAGLLAVFRSKSSGTPAERAASASTAAEEPSTSTTTAPAVQVPSFFLCPITYEIMSDPVTLDTGMTYERASIEEWLENGHNTCPSTNRTLLSHNVIPNVMLQRAIRDWCAANRSSSNSDTVTKLLDTLATETDVGALYNSSKELYTVAEASGRTRRTLRDLGAISVLTQALIHQDSQVVGPGARHWMRGLEYAIATIAMLHPSYDEDKLCLSDPVMVSIMAALLAKGTMTAKINTAKVVQSVIMDWEDGLKIKLGSQWNAMKGVLALIRDDCLNDQEARLGLRVLLQLVSPNWNRLVAIGERAVPSLLDCLCRKGDRRNVEYAFAILEVLAKCEQGRDAIMRHPYGIARIVEYLHGVSVTSTEYAVGTLHSVISLASKRSVIDTALKAGAFTTLLMLLPSECSSHAKSQARDILKLLNEKYDVKPGDDDFSVFRERGLHRHHPR